MDPRSPSNTGVLLVDREIEALLGTAIRVADPTRSPSRAQISPASIDLRIGASGWQIRSGFLPGARGIEERLRELAITRLDLGGAGAVLERGRVYLIELEEELELDASLRARFNPRSSTGRCDIFTRVLCNGHPRFDEAPPGYRGRMWIEVAPLSFPVRIARGDRLTQVRFSRGSAALSANELRLRYERTPLCYLGDRPLGLDEVHIDDEGGLALSVGLAGREPCGWRSTNHSETVEFAREGAHDPFEFFNAVHAIDGHCILAPESFTIFASRERLRVPPDLAAEMLPIDVGIGELRNNYAGFFDNGFGWNHDADRAPGTPAVLEVRAHDVPFLVEDGQPFCRLRFFRTNGRPERLYGEGRRSYQRQDLTLARCFRQPR